MPSETFFRLAEEKKKRLLDSALQEFSRVPYHEASINVMIENAGISRGSFYQYFQDKEDLYHYVLKSHQKGFTNLLIQHLEQANGDFRQTFLTFFDEIITYLQISPYSKFFQNVFCNLNPNNEKFIIPHQERCEGGMLDQIWERVDVTKLKIQEETELRYALDIVLHILIPMVAKAIILESPLTEMKQEYQIKIEMICKGIYRKEHDVC